MIFNLDTNDYESIKLTFTDDDYDQETADLIQEFCFAVSSFFSDFALKLDCDEEQARSLKKVFLGCIDRNIDYMIDEGVLETQADEDEDEVDEDSLDYLSERMEEEGFSDAEIENILQLVKNSGSMDSAIEYLKQVALDAGIDIDSDYE